MNLNTCILGRMCFVERSIRLIEEQCIILDRSSGFRSFHRLFYESNNSFWRSRFKIFLKAGTVLTSFNSGYKEPQMLIIQ